MKLLTTRRSKIFIFGALFLALTGGLAAFVSGLAMPGPSNTTTQSEFKNPVEPGAVVRMGPEQLQTLISRLVPSRYVWAASIDDRMLKVALRLTTVGVDDSLYGVVNAEENEIIPPVYSDITYNKQHRRFKVTLGQGEAARQGVMDERGNVIVPMLYEHLIPISNMGSEPTVVAHRDGKAGYVSILTGEVLVLPLYDALVGGGKLTDGNGKGLLVAIKDDMRGLIDTQGKVLSEFEFDGFDNAESGLVGRRAKGSLLFQIQNGQLVSITPHAAPHSASQAGGPVVGIGVRLQPSPEGSSAVIEAVALGGPAAAAQLRPADKILEVDGRKVSAMSMQEVTMAIRGEAGTEVKLKVQRGGKTWGLTINRAPIVSP